MIRSRLTPRPQACSGSPAAYTLAASLLRPDRNDGSVLEQVEDLFSTSPLIIQNYGFGKLILLSSAKFLHFQPF